MVGSIARHAAWALVVASALLLQGCGMLAWLFGATLPGAAHVKAATGKDGPLLGLVFSFSANLDLKPCQQTADALGFTEHCDFMFPDGTTIRSVFE